MEQFGLVSLSSLYQCPQCQTSLTDMSSHWRHMDTEREAWQLPQHLQEFKVKVCALKYMNVSVLNVCTFCMFCIPVMHA